jgi:hypothetical protein
VKLTVSTREGAALVGVTERSFHRWAAERDIHPERRQRIGRSTITVWSVAAIRAGQRARYARQVTPKRAEITTLPVECPTSGQPAEVA